jgi:hypothetical protein
MTKYFIKEFIDHLMCSDIVKSVQHVEKTIFAITTIYGNTFVMQRSRYSLYKMEFLYHYEHSDPYYISLVLRDINYTLGLKLFYGKVDGNNVNYRTSSEKFKYNVIAALPQTSTAKYIKNSLYAKYHFNELKGIKINNKS